MKEVGVSIVVDQNVEDANGGQLSERDLVSLIASGDAEAFAVIFRKYERQLFRTAVRITENVSDAEDVLQEAFLRAYKKIATFQFASSLYSWLTRIVINCALMELRRRRSRPSFSLNDSSDDGVSLMDLVSDPRVDVETALSLKEQSRLLTARIARLPQKLRVIIETYRTSDVSMAQLAEAHTTSVAAVKARLFRARKMVKTFKNITNDPSTLCRGGGTFRNQWS